MKLVSLSHLNVLLQGSSASHPNFYTPSGLNSAAPLGVIKVNLSNIPSFSLVTLPSHYHKYFLANKCEVCIHTVKLIQLDTLFFLLLGALKVQIVGKECRLLGTPT